MKPSTQRGQIMQQDGRRNKVGPFPPSPPEQMCHFPASLGQP